MINDAISLSQIHEQKYQPILHTIQALEKGPIVTIVGGGAAGAYAAFWLQHLGCDVTVINKGKGRLRISSQLSSVGETNLGGMRFPDSHRFVMDAIARVGLACNLEKFPNYNPMGFYRLRGEKARFKDYRKLAYIYEADSLPDPKVLMNEIMASVLDELGAKDGELAIETALREGHQFGYITLREHLLNLGYCNEQIAYLGHIDFIYPYIDTPIGELAVDRFSLYGSNQYYRLKLGLEALPDLLLAKSGAKLINDATVEAVETNGRGSLVSFHTPLGNRTISSDFVLMTSPAPVIGSIKFDNELIPKQQEAFREVGYASSSKTLVEATHPFWRDEDIDGGRSWTDGAIQQAVYPAGISSGTTSTFVASYTWQDNAKRMMAIQGPEQRFELIAEELEKIHPGCRVFLKRYEHIDWDKESQGGAFAYYKPGDYQRFHAYLSTPHPHNDPRVFFCGEANGLHHGWAESALQSAQWAILQMLDTCGELRITNGSIQ